MADEKYYNEIGYSRCDINDYGIKLMENFEHKTKEVSLRFGRETHYFGNPILNFIAFLQRNIKVLEKDNKQLEVEKDHYRSRYLELSQNVKKAMEVKNG